MRYALISDIHANLPALEAVLADIDADDSVDAIYHLGDLVGYAPWPDEVALLLKDRSIAGVAGNYDSTVATDYKHCGCSYTDPRDVELAHLSYEWTRSHIAPDTKVWLGSLPFRIDIRPLGGHVSGPVLTLVHGNETLNTVYVTEARTDAFLTKMGHRLGVPAGSVVAFGHTHLPFHRVVNGIHFVNTGSVGRPKDADPRAGYVLLDFSTESPAVEFRRVEYDVESAATAILASDLPGEFADYLRKGGRS